LHFSTSPAAQFFAAADAGRSSGWCYLSGIVLVGLCWVFGGAYVYGLTLQLSLGAVTQFAAVNASILMLMVGVLGVTLLLHRRPWRTLVTPQPRIDWRRMATGGAVWGVLLLLGAVVESLLFPGRYAWTPDWSRWPAFVVAALLLTPLQCMAEEIAFRGYLMQGLSRLWRRKLERECLELCYKHLAENRQLCGQSWPKRDTRERRQNPLRADGECKMSG
jgi:membrane protease YdiL (CAAX protease family)